MSENEVASIEARKQEMRGKYPKAFADLERAARKIEDSLSTHPASTPEAGEGLKAIIEDYRQVEEQLEKGDINAVIRFFTETAVVILDDLGRIIGKTDYGILMKDGLKRLKSIHEIIQELAKQE